MNTKRVLQGAKIAKIMTEQRRMEAQGQTRSIRDEFKRMAGVLTGVDGVENSNSTWDQYRGYMLLWSSTCFSFCQATFLFYTNMFPEPYFI